MDIKVPDSAFISLIAGDLLNAYYSALLLKKGMGIEITHDVETETMKEISEKWAVFREVLVKPLASLG